MTAQSAIPLKWYVPFANGDASRVELPVTTADPTRASQTLGFPPLTMQPPESGGVPPQGEDFNGGMNQVARIAWWVLNGGGWPYDATFATNSNINGYPNGAKLQSADFRGDWINTADNNQNNPDTNGTNWVPGFQYGVTALSGLTGGTVTPTPAQAAKNSITLAGTLGSALTVVLPIWTKNWTITNNTTGAFVTIVKTASGSGVTIPQNGLPTRVSGDGTNIVQAAENVAQGASATSPAQISQVHSAYATRGLSAQNNTGTPNTKYDISSNIVVLRNPTLGSLATIVAPATVTNDITVAGSTANGRDQAAAFVAGNTIHLYYIWNGTTLASLSSLTAPTTGPTLPTGYTHWCYVCANVLLAGPALSLVKTRGAWSTYDSPTVILTGTATVNTAFSTAALVPANAEAWRPLVQNLALTATGAGAYSLTLFLDSYQVGFQGTGAASAVSSVSGGVVELPNVSQSATYRLTVGAGTGPTTTIQVHGYKNPNGGE